MQKSNSLVTTMHESAVASMKLPLIALVCLANLSACGNVKDQKTRQDGALYDASKAAPVNAETLTPVIVSPSWKLVWRDEFDGDELDRSKWSVEENCWGGGNNEKQCYVDSTDNIQIADGQLHIIARHEPTVGSAVPHHHEEYVEDNTRELPFSSARLTTQNKAVWQYGRVEVRAKLPAGQGVWPAIWMLPEDNIYGSWAASGEIDIMEAVNLGTPSDGAGELAGQAERRVHGTLHYGGEWPSNTYTGAGILLPGTQSPSDDFFTYAIEWEPQEVRWYVDNFHFATQLASNWFSEPSSNELKKLLSQPEHANAPFNQPFYLLLNLAIGGEWPENANSNGIDKSNFPKRFIVDYVRVYNCPSDEQNSDSPINPSGCASRDPNARLVK